jgi:Holliday junction resolvase RusA-like endonuclease
MKLINIKPFSINKTYGVGKKGKLSYIITTKEFKSFKKSLYYLLPNKNPLPEGDLRLDTVIYFKGNRSDIDNPVKSFLDTLADKYDFNDKLILI